jgi:hypothetical protein
MGCLCPASDEKTRRSLNKIGIGSTRAKVFGGEEALVSRVRFLLEHLQIGKEDPSVGTERVNSASAAPMKVI